MMLTPTKYENLQKNIFVLGSELIKYLKYKPYNIERLFQIIKNCQEINLEKYLDIILFLWLGDIIEIEEYLIRLKEK